MLAAVLVGTALALLFFWSLGGERRALQKMAADDRRTLYTRQLESLKLMCPSPPTDEALKSRCRAQAEFLAEFPECLEECRLAVGPLLSHPTR